MSLKKKLFSIFSTFFVLLILTSTNVFAKDSSNITFFTKYVVKSGDSLWKISKRFNSSIANLYSANHLSNYNLYPGQVIYVPPNNIYINAVNIKTSNYTVQSNDNIWSISKKFNTSIDAIMKSNMLVTNTLMPGQTLTIPVNSKSTVLPKGITIYKNKINYNYGDVYTWKNAMRVWTVNTTGTLKDLYTGISFNVKYYGGSNHSDVVPLTLQDTNKLKKIVPKWSWSAKRPMILYFRKNGMNYQMAVSFTGFPHSTTNIYNNGVNGHFDLYFYNSKGHSNPKTDPTAQKNILKASGR
ncbi:LysM peptidoglycan-binding domain-containing protein [Clostridium oceanicum]|uniref:LysM domain-containing protein n=1 Tax=Clostridium oceanicum TaxID=1543 RepID=A0ABP3UQT1_9CLOT